MPPEAVMPAVAPEQGGAAGTAHVWRGPLLRLALAWAGLLAFLAGDWADMAVQWWTSSTYNHILLIPAVIAWLVWIRRRELGRLAPQAWWPGLVLVALALFVWLLGALSGLNLVRQLGAVAAMQAAVAALLGSRVTAGLLFPLAYAFFLVPFGDELVPLLQMVTARLTIAFTLWSGVPANIDGVFIDTPAGLFEVAEACSGVKFLIAMIALAVLIGHVCFRSWRRRAVLMVFAVVLPVVANGIRAWGTIYIAQFRGIAFAQGFDHILYGWVFFALVMAILLAGAWRFFDREADDAAIDPDAILASPLLARLSAWSIDGRVALAAIIMLIAVFGLWFAGATRLAARLPSAVELPAVNGWKQVRADAGPWWEPRARGAQHRLFGRYRDAAGREVDVFLALYSSQRQGAEAGGFGEGALIPDSPWRWLGPGPDFRGGLADRLLGQGRVHRLAVTYYRTGDLLTGSRARLRLANMRDSLLLRARPTMMLILSAEDREDRPAAGSIAAFSRATGPLGEWIDAIAGLP